MYQILQMQLRQILGGRMKWLVVVILLLPVLLTVAVVVSGGFDEIGRELEREKARQALIAGEMPATARRVTWEGEDLEIIGDILRLTEEGLRLYGRPMERNRPFVVNDGFVVIKNGEIWIDESKRPQDGEFRLHPFSRHAAQGHPGPELDFTIGTIGATYLFLLYPQVICLLISLFYGTSVLGHELGGKTLTYLFTRPLPRWQFVVGKYLGIVGALALPTALSLWISWVILDVDGGFRTFGALLAGTMGALLAFNALFIFFGFLVPRRAMIAALIYGVIFELILSFIPALVNQITITYYLRSVVVHMLGIEIPREAVRVVGGASPLGAVVALAGITIGTLALSSWLAAHREYVIRDEA